jgi:hypothetical protein
MTPELLSTEQVPFQNGLQPVPIIPIPEPREKKPHRKKSGIKAQEPAGTSNPPVLPRTGQPHAVLHLKVIDPAGGKLPGAKVLLSEQNGNQWSGVSDAQGEFSMSFLPLGVYTLTVQSAGFASYQNVIEAGDPGLVNLQVGLHVDALMGDIVIIPIKPMPIQFDSSVSTTFRPDR